MAEIDGLAQPMGKLDGRAQPMGKLDCSSVRRINRVLSRTSSDYPPIILGRRIRRDWGSGHRAIRNAREHRRIV